MDVYSIALSALLKDNPDSVTHPTGAHSYLHIRTAGLNVEQSPAVDSRPTHNRIKFRKIVTEYHLLSEAAISIYEPALSQ